MKISINWIKEFVDLSGIDEKLLTERFNLATAEIEDVEYKGKETYGVVFGKILSVENVEGSDHLHKLLVDVGSEKLQIVCGAPNVRVGMTTCVAKVGGCVCGKKIGNAKLAGVESFGMCCSERELDLGADDDGIMDLEGDYVLGKDIKEEWPVDDIVFEVDNKSLTNRPDLWGHYGMAREFSVIFDRPLKPLEKLDLTKFDGLKKVDINVESENCYRYSAISVDNVTVKKSPMTMKIRLNYCGMRDINLLADITNYTMLEVGEPMHAFDNKIVKGINVIAAKKGDKMLTLEGEEHEVPENAILIADENKVPCAIAGIKGGLKSGITDETNSVLFEAAVFDCVSIRKTSKAIGLVTDASQRYEKSLDPEITTVALGRILKTLSDIDNKIIVTSCLSDCYKKHYDKITIETTAEFISRRMGKVVTTEEVVKILKGLGFGVVTENEVIKVDVPSFRATKDISMREDLVEEVARMVGYDNIVPEKLKMDVEPIVQDNVINYEYEAKKLLAEKYNANEVHSYLWNYSDFNKEYKIETQSYLKLLDASNSGHSGIRSELLPSLLRFYVQNKGYSNNVRLFEIARTVTGLDENNLAIEEKHLAIVLASSEKSEFELLDEAKQIIFDLSVTIAGSGFVELSGKSDKQYLHPINNAKIQAVHDVGEFGFVGSLNPEIAQKMDKKFKVVLIDIDFNKFTKLRFLSKKAKEVSKFPTVDFDLNILVDIKKTYAEVMKVLQKCKSKILKNVALVDIYKNKEQLAGKKSMTFRFTLGSFDRTLETKEVEDYRESVIATIVQNGLELR